MPGDAKSNEQEKKSNAPWTEAEIIFDLNKILVDQQLLSKLWEYMDSDFAISIEKLTSKLQY